MIRIVFVCHGNICRSPVAERWLRHLAEQAGCGEEFVAASRALSSEEIHGGRGNPLYPPMRRLLEKAGVSGAGHTARLLTREEYEQYDYIIGMEQRHVERMQRLFGGDPAHKLSRLLDFTAHPQDIEDPWYSERYDTVFRQIQDGCDALMAQCRQIKSTNPGRLPLRTQGEQSADRLTEGI